MKSNTKNGQPLTKKPRAKTLLTGPAGMGGLIGGEGYSNQDRYIVCRLPEWDARPGFSSIWIEGTGDVDVFFDNLPEADRYAEHVQVKGNNITPAQLKEIVEFFVAWEANKNRNYRKYVVACPGLNRDVSNLRSVLKRLKDVPGSVQISNEWADLTQRLTAMGLESHIDFIFKKLEFDTRPGALGDDDTCGRHFVGTFLKQDKYQSHVHQIAHAVYLQLLREVQLRKGKELDSPSISAIIEAALRSPNPSEPFVGLTIHSWQREENDLDASSSTVLNWLSDFDRDERRVPVEADWNIRLLPALRDFKKGIQANANPPKLIRYRGRGPLSVGFALGATFPSVGGWSIEIPQGPELWRTDALRIPGYQLQVRNLEAEEGLGHTPGSDTILVIVAITQSNLLNVTRHLQHGGTEFGAAIEVQPFGGASSHSISGAQDANSFAFAMRDELKRQAVQYGANRIHLFYNGPFALAVMLGHWLTTVGQLHLYEWQQPGFVPSFTLKT